ncbi:MAG TPA: SHOCT domain-containing protein [Streptosporangiaceae bacterium]
MPSVAPGMVYGGSPNLLVDYDVRYSLGWQDHPKAGPSIVLVRLRWFGGPVKARFPLTEQGWADAWRALCSADLSAAAAVAAKVVRQAERDSAAAARAALDNESLCYLPRVTFKGGSGGSPLAKDQAYTLRFLRDQITVGLPRQLSAVLSIPYRDVDSVEVSGPGKVGTQLSQVLAMILGLGLLGAVLGFFVFGLAGLMLGAILFGLIGALAGSASTTVESIVRIRAADADLYFLNAAKEPDALRIELAAALAAIDSARGTPRDEDKGSAVLPPASIPDQLGKLASLLAQGTITRDEFEHLKAKLIASP